MSIAPLARDFSGTARLGLALAVASAIGYGTMITATRLSYDAGSNPLTLICARAAVPAAILALLKLARGRAFALRPGALRPVAGIALGQLGTTIGYLTASACPLRGRAPSGMAELAARVVSSTTPAAIPFP